MSVDGALCIVSAFEIGFGVNLHTGSMVLIVEIVIL